MGIEQKARESIASIRALENLLRKHGQSPSFADALEKIANHIESALSDEGQEEGSQPEPVSTAYTLPEAKGVAAGVDEESALASAPPCAPVGVEQCAREAVALSLDERGFHQEAQNVREGEDLYEYLDELLIARIAAALAAQQQGGAA